MEKYQQKAKKILQFVNGKMISVVTLDNGSGQTTIRDGLWTCSSSNLLNNSFFDHFQFSESCPDIIWERDIYPSVLEIRVGEVVSVVITFFFEKESKKTMLSCDEYIDDHSMARAELQIVIKKDNEVITLKRNLFFQRFPDADSVRQKIREEIDEINKNYSFPFCTIDDLSKADIILPAGTGGIFIHEAIGHCLEADLYYKKGNILNGCIGKSITKNKDIIISDTCLPNNLLNYKISDDGTIPSSVTLIENGKLVGIMTDSFYSSVFGVGDSGNGRASDISCFPLPRMRNTFLHNGKENPGDIFESTKFGLVPIEIQGGNVVVETGHFVFNIASALLVKKGSVIGITKPFLFSSNVLESLNSIKMIGNDLKFCLATCGKCGQLVDVAYGTPTVLISQR